MAFARLRHTIAISTARVSGIVCAASDTSSIETALIDLTHGKCLADCRHDPGPGSSSCNDEGYAAAARTAAGTDTGVQPGHRAHGSASYQSLRDARMRGTSLNRETGCL